MSSGSYNVLGLTPHATGEEIKQAYRAMALRWHPDRHPADTENATQCFLEVQDAYQTLMRERFPLNPRSSSTLQGTEYASAYQTYQTRSNYSRSTSSVSSPTQASSMSSDSAETPTSAVESNMSSCKCRFSGVGFQNGKGPAVVPHTPQYSRSFTIIPPAKKQYSPPQAMSSRDFYLLHGRHQTVPLHSFGIGPSKEWIYGMALSLEDLLNGKLCSFSLSRVLVTGETKKVILDVEIPPGCREGTRIVCRGVGHERKDRTRQDIVFIIEELNHEHFLRVGNDLVLEVKLPCDDYLRHRNGDFVVEGLDRQKHVFCVEYDRVLTGKHAFTGSGMPIRHQGQVIGRGNLIVQWEIIPQHPRVFNFMKRFMHFRR
ncbi:hypothetical protein AGABI2DRAFT_183863 [Agaricus bisporus var. bisporus H97]|uniref:hypothetical protein n=1 Tax=Agaricus bisporus var. bisporus (strain H97 / ATCC MYA-4626 / FGSC 10389) TaxID=936046 RepID=UPI00029F650F|nr:hypothetical protein AGABI2DRAFT_183863 [Agaricus bisporus var. bisporus H97]EKV48989.1 hypothetical protein AGABI2DRAFT_183863 [Agaricus bisporus var. bisporus H97]